MNNLPHPKGLIGLVTAKLAVCHCVTPGLVLVRLLFRGNITPMSFSATLIFAAVPVSVVLQRNTGNYELSITIEPTF